MLVRRIARPLLASSFVYGGVDTLRNPGSRVPGAKPVVQQIAEAAQEQLPVEVPQDTEQWVKIDAGIKVGAGVLFALGRFPRISALALAASIVPTTLAGHRFWEDTDDEKKFSNQAHFLKNAGLLGGLLLAAVDTEGKPSAGWRVRRASDKAIAAAEANYEKASKKAAKAQKKAAKQAKSAKKSVGV
ncbi:DoxX family protein [Klenkia sp. LSe6-5]|uniref:DoxX family protein n=1 Tax=Klenkia sesuvii TaxID=3103137 RepID=A0ABU8DWJ2_9ACTN